MCAILPRREPEVAEDDVLDARLEEVAAERDRLDRVLVEEVEDDGEVVDAERPQRVLVRRITPEVLPVAVDAEDVAERASVDELPELLHARVVEQQVAGHEHELALLRERDELVDLRPGHRGRLLDEDVLSGLERELRQLVVGRHGRGDDDRVELGIRDHLLEGFGPAGFRISGSELLPLAARRDR